MANAIDKQADTSGQVDASDTSSTDDDTNLDDVTWEDGDVVEETTEESDDDSAATEDSDDTEEDSDDGAEDKDTDADTDSASEDSTDEEQSAEADTANADAERQQRNQEAAARRIAERQQREEAKARATQEALDNSYQVAYDQAIEAGFDENQARLQAAQQLSLQQLQIDAYNNRVMQVTNKVTADLNNAVTQIAEFKSDNPVVREAMLNAVDKFEAMYVQKDANGDAVQVTGDILTFLQNEAETIRRLTGVGAQQQDQAKNTQKKRTLSPPSRAPKQPKVDPDLAAFDEEYARWN